MKKLLTILIFLVMAWCAKTTWDIGQLEQRQIDIEAKQQIAELDVWDVLKAENQAMADIYARLNRLEREVQDLRRPYFVKQDCHGGTV